MSENNSETEIDRQKDNENLFNKLRRAQNRKVRKRIRPGLTIKNDLI